MNSFKAVLALTTLLAGCAAPIDDDASAPEDDAESSEAAVTSGAITAARPEIGLLHIDGVRGLMGDMGWGTGTVVLQRNAVLTSAKVTGGRTLAAKASGHGTFTVKSSRGTTTHRVVEAQLVSGSKLALLRIEPAVDALTIPADIADPMAVQRARVDAAQLTTFLGYGYRNHVCMPMTGSDGYKSYVTRRYDRFGGLFTGPLGVGYTCEADIGGPIVLGKVDERGAVLSVNVNTVLDSFAEPGRVRSALEAVARGWQ